MTVFIVSLLLIILPNYSSVQATKLPLGALESLATFLPLSEEEMTHITGKGHPARDALRKATRRSRSRSRSATRKRSSRSKSPSPSKAKAAPPHRTQGLPSDTRIPPPAKDSHTFVPEPKMTAKRSSRHRSVSKSGKPQSFTALLAKQTSGARTSRKQEATLATKLEAAHDRLFLRYAGTPSKKRRLQRLEQEIDNAVDPLFKPSGGHSTLRNNNHLIALVRLRGLVGLERLRQLSPLTEATVANRIKERVHKDIQILLDEKPDDLWGALMQGELALHKGQTEEAIEALEKALGIENWYSPTATGVLSHELSHITQQWSGLNRLSNPTAIEQAQMVILKAQLGDVKTAKEHTTQLLRLLKEPSSSPGIQRRSPPRSPKSRSSSPKPTSGSRDNRFSRGNEGQSPAAAPTEEVQTLRKEVEALQHKMTVEQRDASQLGEALARSQKKIEASTAQMQKLSEQLKEAQQRSAQLTEQNQRFRQNILQSERAHAKLRASHAELQAEQQRKILVEQQRAKEAQQYSAQMASHNQQLRQHIDQEAQAQARVKEQLQSQLNESNGQLQRVNQKMDQLSRDLAKSQEKATVANLEVQRLQQQFQQNQQQLQEAQRYSAEVYALNEQLRQQISQNQQLRTNLESHLKQQEQRVAQLEEQVRSGSSHASRANELYTQNQQLRQQIYADQQSQTSLQSELQQQRQRVAQLEAQARSYQPLPDRSAEVSRLQQQLYQKDQKIAELKKKLEKKDRQFREQQWEVGEAYHQGQLSNAAPQGQLSNAAREKHHKRRTRARRPQATDQMSVTAHYHGRPGKPPKPKRKEHQSSRRRTSGHHSNTRTPGVQ